MKDCDFEPSDKLVHYETFYVSRSKLYLLLLTVAIYLSFNYETSYKTTLCLILNLILYK